MLILELFGVGGAVPLKGLCPPQMYLVDILDLNNPQNDLKMDHSSMTFSLDFFKSDF